MSVRDLGRRLLGFSSSIYVNHSVATTTKTLDALRDEDDVQLRRCFLWPLGWLIPQRALDSAHKMIKTTLGAFESFDEPMIHRDGYFRVMKALVKFQKARFGVTVTLWGNSVVGIGIHPPISIGLTPAWQSPDYVEEASFTETEVSVRPRSLWRSVKGTLTVPNNGSKVPAVLMVPGSGVLDRDCSLGSNKPFKDVAHGLASAGFAVLRMDKPLDFIVFKQFVMRSLTLYDEYVPHHCAALTYLDRHPRIDSKHIFVLGASLGGGVAPRICAESSLPLAGMISCAGICKPFLEPLISQTRYSQLHFPQAVDEYEKEMNALQAVKEYLVEDPKNTKARDPTQDLRVPLPLSYIRDDYEHNPAEIARTLDMPMLFVQGTQDWQVEADHLDSWRAGLKGSVAGEKAAYRLYEDVGHLLISFENDAKGLLQYDEPGHVKPEIIIDMIQWMEQIVRA